MRTDININLLREQLAYDPLTGIFVWRMSRPGRAKAGAIAGFLDGCGYIAIGFEARRWLAHRLAWAHVHGEPPAGIIDHINRVRVDNRIANLRIASRLENFQNCEYFERTFGGGS